MIGQLLRQNKKFLIFLFIFSFVLNLLFFKFFLKPNKDYIRGDSPFYIQVAQDFIGKETLPIDVPVYIRVPGYSLFLSGCFWMFGDDIVNSLLLQIFLASFIPILIFFLSLTLFPTNILLAKISAFLMAINFGTILYSGFVMSEILFMLFFLMFLILFFSNFELFFCKEKFRVVSYKKIFFAGVFLGISSLIRPVGFFIIMAAVFLIFFSSLFLSQKIKLTILLFLGWFFIVFFWLLKNFLLTGEIFFNSMPGSHFVYYLGSDICSKAKGCDFVTARENLKEEWRFEILKKEMKVGRKLNEIQKCKIAENIVFKYCKKYPVQAVQMYFLNIFKTIFGFHSSVLICKYSSSFPSYDTHTSIWLKLKSYLAPKVKNKFFIFLIYYELIFLIMMYLGFLGCCFYLFNNKMLLCEFLKTLPLIFVFIFLTIGSGVARLRFPVEPFLIIFAAYFWINFFTKELKWS